MTKYWYRDHDGSRKRVWLDGWPSDMFEVLNAEAFADFKLVIERFNAMTKSFNLGEPIQLVEMHDD